MSRHVMNVLSSNSRPSFFAMIHLPPLPGTPGSSLSVPEIIDVATKEAKIYLNAGVDGVIVENMNDIPYVKGDRIGPEIVSAMSMACSAVSNVFTSRRREVALGVQILAGANEAAIAVAHATGWMDGCAGSLLRYRKAIGADNVAVFTDIKKKHSAHSVTADVPIGETAKAAEFFLADGVILTGVATGAKTSPAQLKEVREATSLPVLIGSGVDAWNAKEFRAASALVVGSSLKKDGNWRNALCPDRVKLFAQAVKRLH